MQTEKRGRINQNEKLIIYYSLGSQRNSQRKQKTTTKCVVNIATLKKIF